MALRPTMARAGVAGMRATLDTVRVGHQTRARGVWVPPSPSGQLPPPEGFVSIDNFHLVPLGVLPGAAVI